MTPRQHHTAMRFDGKRKLVQIMMFDVWNAFFVNLTNRNNTETEICVDIPRKNIILVAET